MDRSLLYHQRLKTPLQRFEEKYVPVPESGCWLWLTGDRYGCFTLSGKAVSAHRASWMLFNGDVPDGMQVLHKCDIPSCVNPEHLFLGTQKDNIRDMREKGRAPKGDAVARRVAALPRGRTHHRSSAKLTEDQVREIKAAAGSQREIAERYGVCQQLISKIKRNEYWRHI